MGNPAGNRSTLSRERGQSPQQLAGDWRGSLLLTVLDETASIEIRAAQIETAFLADHLATVPMQLRRAVGTEHGRITLGTVRCGTRFRSGRRGLRLQRTHGLVL